MGEEKSLPYREQGSRLLRLSFEFSLRGGSLVSLIDRLGGQLQRSAVSVELDDIQATVLRDRPEPYYGTHVLLHGRFPVCEGGVLTRL